MSAISALLIIIFIFFIIISAVLGFKLGARRSAYNLAANLISALIAFIISVIIKKPLSSKLYRPLSVRIIDKLGDLSDSSAILTVARQVSISITFILLFAGIYIIIRCIYAVCMMIIMIHKKHTSDSSIENTSDEEVSVPNSKRLSASSLGGVIICIVSCIISVVIILFPVAGAVKCITNALDNTTDQSASSRKYSVIQDKIGPLSNNIVLNGVYSCGGKILFNRFSPITYQDEKVSMSDEAQYVAELYILFSVVKDESYANTPERVAAAESIKTVLDDSTIIPDVSVELIQTAAKSFTNKGSFLGMQLPESNDKIKELYLDMMNSCADASSENIEASLDSFIDIWETMIRYGAISRIKNNDTALSLFADEGFLKEFFLEIYDDDNLKDFIPRIANTGLTMAFESIDLPTDSITDSTISIEGMSRDEISAEADLLTRVIGNINQISISVQSNNNKEQNAQLLSDTVDDLYDSHFFKQITQALLLSVITSYSQNTK